MLFPYRTVDQLPVWISGLSNLWDDYNVLRPQGGERLGLPSQPPSTCYLETLSQNLPPHTHTLLFKITAIYFCCSQMQILIERITEEITQIF